uniref:Uncharacterized protein n=1 Tax=Pararge aegeria TaxID=116150 RepID=S4P135_9NEOP
MHYVIWSANLFINLLGQHFNLFLVCLLNSSECQVCLFVVTLPRQILQDFDFRVGPIIRCKLGIEKLDQF